MSNKPKIPKNFLKPILSFFSSKFFLAGLVIVFSLILLFLSLQLFFLDRIYPGIKIAGVDVSLKTTSQAKIIVENELKNRTNTTLDLLLPTSTQSAEPQTKVNISLQNTLAPIDLNNSINQALSYGRRRFYFQPVDIPVKLYFNTLIDNQLNDLSKSIDQPAINSQLIIENDQIIATPSQDGTVVDKDLIKQDLNNYLNTKSLTFKTIPLKKISPNLSYKTALSIKERLDQIKLQPLVLTFKDQKFPLSLEEVLSLIDLENSKFSVVSTNVLGQTINIDSVTIADQEITDSELTLNRLKTREFLNQIAKQIDREVQEPLFNLDQSNPNNLRINEFKPPLEGQKLDIPKSQEALNQALITPNQKTVNLVVEIVEPKNKLTNDLGIKELIGRGVSNFAGSIPNRIYNVALTASRLNGVLVPPGETFSFLNTVGDISAATGFKQAYVIKSGRTVLDDGGGVCQDSTTLFRAVLNAGLPVVKRTPHAYRVGYYEQGFPPGLDATVFYPSVDFQFKNDTPSHILIQAYVEGTTLYIDLYGTSDGRIANISKPVITSVTPAPPELRQDDPTLPKGTVKQVDFAASGANVSFSRTVVRNGQTLISETFKSNYRPWQAVYLVGTQ